VAGARVRASYPVVISSGYAFDPGRAWFVGFPVAGSEVDPAVFEEADADADDAAGGEGGQGS